MEPDEPVVVPPAPVKAKKKPGPKPKPKPEGVIPKARGKKAVPGDEPDVPPKPAKPKAKAYESFRAALNADEPDRKVIDKKFKVLFPPDLWKTYQNQYNAAIRTPLPLPGNIELKIPTPAQKFWAETANPALGTRGGVIIAPTGTGKSDMIGLIAENNLYYGRTIPSPVPGMPTVQRQVFIVTRTSLQSDLQAKAATAMESRQIRELQNNIKRFGGEIRKEPNFDSKIHIVSYKQFANLLEAKSANGRRLWAGLPLRRDTDTKKEFKYTEGLQSHEIDTLQTAFGYDKLSKKWPGLPKKVLLDNNRNPATKNGDKPNEWTMRVEYKELDADQYQNEAKRLQNYLNQLHMRRQMHPVVVLPIVSSAKIAGVEPIEKKAEKTIAIFVLQSTRNDEEFISELQDVLDGEGENWIKGMKPHNKSQKQTPENFWVLFTMEPADIDSDQQEKVADAFIALLNQKLKEDGERFLEIGDKKLGELPYMQALERDEYASVVGLQRKTAKGKKAYKQLQIQIKIQNDSSAASEMVMRSYLSNPKLGEKRTVFHTFLQKQKIDTIQTWAEKLTIEGLTKFSLDLEDFENAVKQRYGAEDEFGHNFNMIDDPDTGIKTVGIVPDTRPSGTTKEQFHWLDGCTVIFDEAHLFIDRKALKAGEGVESGLILQGVSDADTSVYFFSATVPFLTGLAFMEALQPSIYLRRRLGDNVFTVPSKPFLGRHRKLLDIDSMTSADKRKVFVDLFGEPTDRPLDKLTKFGELFKSRTFGNIGWSPPVELQRDMFSKVIFGGEIPFVIPRESAHLNYLRRVLGRRAEIFKNPSMVTEAINFCNLLDKPKDDQPPDFLRNKVPPYARVSSPDFSLYQTKLNDLFFGGSVPALPGLLTKIQEIDHSNVEKMQRIPNLPLGRVVILSHAKNDIRGIELVASGLRLVGYNWIPIEVNELDEEHRQERKKWQRENKDRTLPDHLRYMRLGQPLQSLPLSEVSQKYGPIDERRNKRNFIVYSSTILGGPDGFEPATLQNVIARIKKTRYNTRYEGRSISSARQADLIPFWPTDDEIEKKKRELIQLIDGKVIYFWPGNANTISIPKPNPLKPTKVEKINTLFKNIKNWGFFHQVQDAEGKMTYEMLNSKFVWLPGNLSEEDRFQEMRKFFIVDKLDLQLREEMTELYKERTNKPGETVNDIGLVLVGSDFLSGIDIFGATSVVKFDVPPTHSLAVQGTGRANRRGGMSQFPFEAWELYEYVMVPQWPDGERIETARRGRIISFIEEQTTEPISKPAKPARGKRRGREEEEIPKEVSVLKEAIDTNSGKKGKEEFLAKLYAKARKRYDKIFDKIEDVKGNIQDVGPNSPERADLEIDLKKLKNDAQILSLLNSAAFIIEQLGRNRDQKLQIFRGAVITSTSSLNSAANLPPGSSGKGDLTPEAFDAEYLQPHEIVRQLVLKDDLSEAFNQLGQEIFKDWAVDYKDYIQPADLPRQVGPPTPYQPPSEEDAKKFFIPTGFYLSWQRFLEFFQPRLTAYQEKMIAFFTGLVQTAPDEDIRKASEEQLKKYQNPSEKAALWGNQREKVTGADVRLEWSAIEEKVDHYKKLRKEKNPSEAHKKLVEGDYKILSDIHSPPPIEGKKQEAWRSYKKRNGTIFSEIVRDPEAEKYARPILYALLVKETFGITEARALFPVVERIVLPIVQELFSIEQKESDLMRYLVLNGIAVWQVRMPMTTIDAADEREQKQLREEEEDESESTPPSLKPTRKRTGKPKGSSKKAKLDTDEEEEQQEEEYVKPKPKRRAKKPSGVDSRFEPYHVVGKNEESWNKTQPALGDYAFKQSAFNAFFDLRLMDKDHDSIQSQLIEGSREFLASFGFNEVYPTFRRAEQISDLFGNVGTPREQGNRLRENFGVLLIDGLLNWNTAFELFYVVAWNLKAMVKNVTQEQCAQFTGLIYRNAVQRVPFLAMYRRCLGADFVIDSQKKLAGVMNLLYAAATFTVAEPRVRYFDSQGEESLSTVLEYICIDLEIDILRSPGVLSLGKDGENILAVAIPARDSLDEKGLPDASKPFNRTTVAFHLLQPGRVEELKSKNPKFDVRFYRKLLTVDPRAENYRRELSENKLREEDISAFGFIARYGDGKYENYADLETFEAMLNRWETSPEFEKYLPSAQFNELRNRRPSLDYRSEILEYHHEQGIWDMDLISFLDREKIKYTLPFWNANAPPKRPYGVTMEDKIVDLSTKSVFNSTELFTRVYAPGLLLNATDNFDWFEKGIADEFFARCIASVDQTKTNMLKFAEFVKDTNNLIAWLNKRTWADAQTVLYELLSARGLFNAPNLQTWLQIPTARLLRIDHFAGVSIHKEFPWYLYLGVPENDETNQALALRVWMLETNDEMDDTSKVHLEAAKKYKNALKNAFIVKKEIQAAFDLPVDEQPKNLDDLLEILYEAIVRDLRTLVDEARGKPPSLKTQKQNATIVLCSQCMVSLSDCKCST